MECCVLCLDIIEDEKQTKLDCGHFFHSCCLNQLQEESIETKCPICRRPFIRTIKVSPWYDNLHWKLFEYGSEMCFSWVSEFETIQGCLNRINFNSCTQILEFHPQTQSHTHFISKTDFWLSTKQLSECIVQWLEREYPIYNQIKIFSMIFSMITEKKTSLFLDLLQKEFVVLKNGTSLYFASPHQPLFELKVATIDKTFALRKSKRWRLSRDERVKLLFNSQTECILCVVEWLKLLHKSVPTNIQQMICYLIQNVDFEDYVLGTDEPIKPCQMVACLGYEFYETNITDWDWYYDDQLDF